MPFYSRKPTRIPGFDYGESYYYFVTVCTHEKSCIFGMGDQLTALGQIAKEDMQRLPEYYDGVVIDHFVIMPNHIHAIIAIKKQQSRSDLSNIVGAYKAGVSRRSRQLYPNMTIWQRSFHDHVIRNRSDYENIWEYIEYNPARWKEDCFYQQRSQ